MGIGQFPAPSAFFPDMSRVLVMEPDMYELVEVLDDIIVLSEKPWKFEARPGVKDIGIARRGVRLDNEADDQYFDVDMIHGNIMYPIVNRYVSAEMEGDPSLLISEAFELTASKVLIFMVQKPDELIRSYVFTEARLQPFEHSFDLGGSMTCCRWSYREMRVIEQFSRGSVDLVDVEADDW